MKAQVKVRATIASGLRAGRTVAEIMQFNILRKSTVKCVKHHYDGFIASRGLQEDFETNRKKHKLRSDTLDDSISQTSSSLVDQDPGRSMISMARELGLSNLTCERKCRRTSSTRAMPSEEASPPRREGWPRPSVA
jgi:hypothetical protein